MSEAHDGEKARRHEAHLVGQIYHLIEANHRLEEQLHRLGKVTEIADLFREKRITRDTFELRAPKLLVPVQAETAWNRIDKMLSRLDTDLAQSEAGLGGLQRRLDSLSTELGRVEQEASAVTAAGEVATPPAADGPAPAGAQADDDEATRALRARLEAKQALAEELRTHLADQAEVAGAVRARAAAQGEAAGGLRESLTEVGSVLGGLRGNLVELRDGLGVVRESAWSVDPDWLSDVRGRLVAAEQAIAFLNEQSRELDMLRREKDSIMDGATRLEQNMEDLWKALNEKTTHIQRLEAQLTKVWASLPYRVYRTLTRPFRRGNNS